MTDLVTREELIERLGGSVTPDTLFMTALAMMLELAGGSFTYSESDIEAFKLLHAEYGQLGIQIDGNTVTVFLYDAPQVGMYGSN